MVSLSESLKYPAQTNVYQSPRIVSENSPFYFYLVFFVLLLPFSVFYLVVLAVLGGLEGPVPLLPETVLIHLMLTHLLWVRGRVKPLPAGSAQHASIVVAHLICTCHNFV